MTAADATLLVVEDDATLRELLAASLRFAGFEVACAETGTAALAMATAQRPDLVLLDVMLPDLDGFDVLRRLRAAAGGQSRMPVLLLTARDSPQDTVTGLTAGADDYVTKPFGLEELIARIRAILRRTGGRAPADALQVSDLRLEPAARQVLRGGAPIALSPTEFTLLQYLMENTDEVLSKAQILDRVWRYDFGGDESIVESYISYLRRKIDTGTPRLIHTVRGLGYVLRRPHG